MPPDDLSTIMRAIGSLEGKVDSFYSLLKDDKAEISRLWVALDAVRNELAELRGARVGVNWMLKLLPYLAGGGSAAAGVAILKGIF